MMGAWTAGTTIDWNEVHRRLAEAEAQLRRSFAGEGPWAERLLRRRRDVLARQADQDVAAPLLGGSPWDLSARPVLRLRGRSLSYALPAAELAEIAAVGRIAAVPGGPPGLRGLISLRGHVLRLFDLDALVGTEAPPAGGGFAVRLRDDDTALWASAVLAVGPLGEVRPAGPDEAFRLVRGLAPGGCLVLDLGALRAAIDTANDAATDGGGETP